MNEKPKKRKIMQPNGVVNSMIHPHPSQTDPMGSWTGLPADEDTRPIQDADDL